MYGGKKCTYISFRSSEAQPNDSKDSKARRREVSMMRGARVLSLTNVRDIGRASIYNKVPKGVRDRERVDGELQSRESRGFFICM